MNAEQQRLRRRRRVRLVLAAAVSALLALAAWQGQEYLEATKDDKAGLPAASAASRGSERHPLLRPIGLCLTPEGVLVTDAGTCRVTLFDRRGRYVRSFDDARMQVPLYPAYNPLDGTVWVSDRGSGTVHVFDSGGRYLKRFAPKLPTGAVKWAPVGLAFAPDGTLYVTDLSVPHRLLAFDADGKLLFATDASAPARVTPDASPGLSYPNAVRVRGEEVWVADGNNRRLQVFDTDGRRLRVMETNGVTRGFDFFPASAPWPGSLAILDTLANKVVVREPAGLRVAEFGARKGEQGFSYPNDLVVDEEARIFVADTANSRLQLWEWPKPAAVRAAETGVRWLWALVPVPVMLALLRRRQAFFATRDFLEAVLLVDAVDVLEDRTRRWLVSRATYESIESGDWGERLPLRVFTAVDRPGPDAEHLALKLDIDGETAAVLAIVERSFALCSQDPELRRLAQALGAQTFDITTFMEAFGQLKPWEPGDEAYAAESDGEDEEAS